MSSTSAMHRVPPFVRFTVKCTRREHGQCQQFINVSQGGATVRWSAPPYHSLLPTTTAFLAPAVSYHGLHRRNTLLWCMNTRNSHHLIQYHNLIAFLSSVSSYPCLISPKPTSVFSYCQLCCHCSQYISDILLPNLSCLFPLPPFIALSSYPSRYLWS